MAQVACAATLTMLRSEGEYPRYQANPSFRYGCTFGCHSASMVVLQLPLRMYLRVTLRYPSGLPFGKRSPWVPLRITVVLHFLFRTPAGLAMRSHASALRASLHSSRGPSGSPFGMHCADRRAAFSRQALSVHPCTPSPCAPSPAPVQSLSLGFLHRTATHYVRQPVYRK